MNCYSRAGYGDSTQSKHLASPLYQAYVEAGVANRQAVHNADELGRGG